MVTYRRMNGFNKVKIHTQLSEEILVLNIGRWDMCMFIALSTLSSYNICCRRAFRLFFQFTIQNGSGNGFVGADTSYSMSSLTAESN
jgi:hypothetical protein